MTCRDLDTQLTAYLDGELIAEASLSVENHLASCEACRRRLEIERHNLNAIRQAAKAGAPVAPEQFKARLFENLRRDGDQQRRSSVRRFAAMAAGVTVALVVGHQSYRSYQRRLYEQDAAFRHARQLPLEVTQGNEGVQQWFGGKVDYRVNVPSFPNAKCAGGRLLNVRDKQAAYIRYDGARPMGLFVYGDDGDVDVGTEPAMGSSHGYNVVSWREGDVVYQLVSDLNEDDIRELVPGTNAQPQSAPVQGTPQLDVRPAALRQ